MLVTGTTNQPAGSNPRHTRREKDMARKRIIEADTDINWMEKAMDRVEAHPALADHEGVIFSDWAEEDHMEWVATAHVDEIVDWAETVTT